MSSHKNSCSKLHSLFWEQNVFTRVCTFRIYGSFIRPNRLELNDFTAAIQADICPAEKTLGEFSFGAF